MIGLFKMNLGFAKKRLINTRNNKYEIFSSDQDDAKSIRDRPHLLKIYSRQNAINWYEQ